jgi:hypothetical protein
VQVITWPKHKFTVRMATVSFKPQVQVSRSTNRIDANKWIYDKKKSTS